MAARMLFGLGENRRSAETPPLPSAGPARSAEHAMVAAARAGDLRAWLGITRRYQEALFRSAWITSRDAAAAEEIAGRTFTRAYRSTDSLDDGAAVLPWLMTISTTVARAYLRELAQRRDARSIDLITSPRLPAAPYRQDPRLPSPTRFEREALVSAFDRASDHDRLILASRYGFGLDRASAAARLGASPDEIEKDLRASIRRLREHVVEAMAEPVLSGPRSVESAAGALNVPSQRGHQAPGRILSLPDDALGALTMSAVLAEMTWTPDVAIIVCDGLAREAVTYPAGHERRARGSASHHERSIAAHAGASSTGDPGTAVAGGAPQRRGWSFPRSTALLLGAGLVAFSFAAAASGPGTSGDVGARFAALVGPADTDQADTDVRPGIAQAIPTSVAAGPSAVPNEPGTLPQVDDTLGLSIVSARARASGDIAARIRLDWERPPEMGTVVRTRLERRVGDGEWTTIERVDRAGPVRAAIKARERYAFRLRSFDAGGVPVVSPEAQFELVARGPRSRSVTRQGGGWVVRTGPLGRRLVATEPQLSVKAAFTGNHVALVGPAGPNRGAIAVRVDDGPWVEDDLRSRQRSDRAILFSQELDDRQHDLDIRAGASGLALDSILFLRSVSPAG